MNLVLFLGEEFWATRLATGLSEPDLSLDTRYVAIYRGVPSLLRLVSWALSAKAIVRVGSIPGFAPELYELPRTVDSLTLRERIKRLLFQAGPQHKLRKIVLKTALFLRHPRRLARFYSVNWVLKTTHRINRGRNDYFYWIGTDVLTFRKGLEVGAFSRSIVRDMQRMKSLAVAPHLVDELKSLGFEACYMPFPKPLAAAPRPLPPMPARFTVLSYLPESRFEFYGGQAFLAAARQMPDVDFLVFGGESSGEQDDPPNITYLGFVDDPETVYAQSSVFVRLPEHDGSPVTVAEALLFGRPVIYSYSLPKCIHVAHDDAEGLVRELKKLYAAHSEGRLVPDDEAAEWALHEYDSAKCYTSLAQLLIDGSERLR